MKEYSYWLDTLPERPVADSVPRIPSTRVDAVVVGAGYAGLAASRALARAGAAVLVLEREHVGWGGSSRNAGQVLTGLKLDPRTLVARYGETRARRLFDAARDSIARLEMLIADESIVCDYERAGHIQAAAKASHFKAFHAEQALLARVFDHHVELIPPDEQRRELGSDVYHGLLVDERSGALNPALYVHGLAKAAARAGASIVTGVAVTRARRQSGAWTVSTSAGDVGARDVLFATDAYTDRAAPALQRRFVPVGSYIIVTAPLTVDQAASILPHRRTVYDSKHVLHYFRLTADRRLLFGGRAAFSQPDSGTIHRAAHTLRRELEIVFPHLAGIAVDYAWGGAVAFTRDQLPRAGMLDGLFYAGGYSGHGVAMATYLGELIARRMAGEPIEQPLFDDRFPAIPMYSGRPWFLPLVGAYYRLLDFVD